MTTETGNNRSLWQEIVDNLLVNAKESDIWERFASTEVSRHEKIILCYKSYRSQLMDFLNDVKSIKRFNKSDLIAFEYRQKGNEYFKKHDDSSAFEMYTKAILYAKENSEEIELAYGNRSAVLFHLGNYKECVSDIDESLAINKNSCVKRTQKLLERRKKCLINQNSDSKDEFQSLLSNFQHNDFPGALNKIEMKYNEKKGRYIISKENLSPGETIFVEAPFAFVCLPDRKHLHCHNCCNSTLNPFPCENCAEGSYCSKNCRKEAWNSFHKWECSSGLGLDLMYHIGIAHLGLRVSLVGLDKTKEKEYERVENLIYHLDIMEPEESFLYFITSVLLIIYLEMFTDIFKTIEMINFGTVILKHIAQLISNGNALTSYCSVSPKQNIFEFEQKRIATGIFVSTSMMNHSCDPTVFHSFHGKYIMVNVVKPVKPGQEIFNCYGPDFRTMSKLERQEILNMQYKFNCECSECTKKYQFYDKMNIIYCPKCKNTVNSNLYCGICKILIKENYIKDMRKWDCDNLDLVDLKYLEKSLYNVEKYHDKYSTHVMKRKDLMAKYFSQNGQYKESMKIVKESIATIQKKYGEISLELFHEIDKYLNILKTLKQNFVSDKRFYTILEKEEKEYKETAKKIVNIFFPKCHYIRKLYF